MEKHFPPMIINNFFDDPYYVVDIARKAEYFPPEKNKSNQKWPGVRSRSLHETHNQLYDYILAKIFSCYYDLDNDIKEADAAVYFHKTPYGKTPPPHTDYDVQLAGLVYLDKGVNSELGTTIYDDDGNEVIRVASKFNTMVCYDGTYLHGPTCLEKIQGERLTMPFFVASLNARFSPMGRIHHVFGY